MHTGVNSLDARETSLREVTLTIVIVSSYTLLQPVASGGVREHKWRTVLGNS